MNTQQIEAFFKTLDKELGETVNVVLTGAAAGSIYGGVRPSLDIDFAIRPKKESAAVWEKINDAVQKTIKMTGIPANYSEDIERWGMISLLDYDKHCELYKKYTYVRLFLMDPVYWAIGKLTRSVDADVLDLVRVFKAKKVEPERAVKLWATAVRSSPRSLAQFQFIANVKNFLTSHGASIWGPSFEKEAILATFDKNLKEKS